MRRFFLTMATLIVFALLNSPLTAYWLDDQMQPAGSRPVCAYPDYVKYNGKGDTRDVSSFSCIKGVYVMVCHPFSEASQ